MITSKIEKGFGDIDWAVNIGKLVAKIDSSAEITFFLYGLINHNLEKISERTIFSQICPVNSLEKIIPSAGTCFVWDNDGQENFHFDLQSANYFAEKFCNIVIFHDHYHYDLFSDTKELEGKFTSIDEYGYLPDQCNIFFQDFSTTYPDQVVNTNNPIRLTTSLQQFYQRLSQKQQQAFALEKMQNLEYLIGDSPYFFSYAFQANSKTIIDSSVSFIKLFARTILNCYKGNKEITILTTINWQTKARFHASEENPKYKDSDPSLSVQFELRVKELVKKFFLQTENENVVEFKLGDAKIRVISYEFLSPEAFHYLLLKSEQITGCTGDMSITQVLSSNRLCFYELLGHKKLFFNHLNQKWLEIQKDMKEQISLSFWESDCVFNAKCPLPEQLEIILEKFLAVLRQNSFEEWFVAKSGIKSNGSPFACQSLPKS